MPKANFVHHMGLSSDNHWEARGNVEIPVRGSWTVLGTVSCGQNQASLNCLHGFACYPFRLGETRVLYPVFMHIQKQNSLGFKHIPQNMVTPSFWLTLHWVQMTVFPFSFNFVTDHIVRQDLCGQSLCNGSINGPLSFAQGSGCIIECQFVIFSAMFLAWR